jgi:hypothetical protein
MTGVIRIEISLLGYIRVYLAQPGKDKDADNLWRLYCALRPQIQDLEKAARRAGLSVAILLDLERRTWQMIRGDGLP